MARGIGRNGELFRELCDPAHLIRSARAAARGKRRKPDVAKFLLELEPECFRLAHELSSGLWRPGSYHTFTILEPKPRLISAAPFADRVVHHAIVALLEPHFEKRFVEHSYACRKGKGTHRALLRASELSRRRKYVLKGDVVKFFPSIDHEILKQCVRRVIADTAVLRVLDLIIDGSNPQEPAHEWFDGDDLFAPACRARGIPIGNLTSQFLANVFLDHLDHAVMDSLGCGEYIRYCDDFLIFSDDSTHLWSVRRAIERLLGDLRLRLHPRKGGVHATWSTIPFLGFTLRRGHRRLQRGGIVRATRRLRRGAREVIEGVISEKGLRARVAAWLGHARFASNPRAAYVVISRARSSEAFERGRLENCLSTQREVA